MIIQSQKFLHQLRVECCGWEICELVTSFGAGRMGKKSQDVENLNKKREQQHNNIIQEILHFFYWNETIQSQNAEKMNRWWAIEHRELSILIQFFFVPNCVYGSRFICHFLSKKTVRELEFVHSKRNTVQRSVYVR